MDVVIVGHPMFSNVESLSWACALATHWEVRDGQVSNGRLWRMDPIGAFGSISLEAGANAGELDTPWILTCGFKCGKETRGRSAIYEPKE